MIIILMMIMTIITIIIIIVIRKSKTRVECKSPKVPLFDF